MVLATETERKRPAGPREPLGETEHLASSPAGKRARYLHRAGELASKRPGPDGPEGWRFPETNLPLDKSEPPPEGRTDHAGALTAETPTEVLTCVHHWIIEPALDRTSRGICKRCGAEAEFENYWDEDRFMTGTDFLKTFKTWNTYERDADRDYLKELRRETQQAY